MNHQHTRYDEDDEFKCVAIDEHVCLQPIDGSDAVVLGTPEADAYGTHLAGFIVGHDRPGFDVRCEGFVHVDGGSGNQWSMIGSLEGGDLTLSPSILCKAPTPVWHEDTGRYTQEDPVCGFHGFVRDGKWVPA